MADKNWKLKENANIDVDDVAKIACALKSLSVYTAAVCDEDDDPEELKAIVEEGMKAVEKIFEI